MKTDLPSFLASSKSERASQHWRILAGMAGGGILGALVFATVFQLAGDAFGDLWIGGAVGGLPGVMLGVAWQLADPGRRRESHALFIGSVAIPSVVLFGIAASAVVGGSPGFGVDLFGPPRYSNQEARAFVRKTAGHELPQGIRTIFLSRGKVQFELAPVALDSVEAAIGLDSTWTVHQSKRIGSTYVITRATSNGEVEELYQRENAHYSVTWLDTYD